MVLRPIGFVSRLLKHQNSPNFWIGRNGAATLANAKDSDLDKKQLDKRYVISYLQNSCGLSSEKAIYASKRVNFDCPDRPNAIVDFLGKQGFARSQIADLVAKEPRLLLYDPHKCLFPKFEFLFHSTGISEADILNLVCKFPTLLTRSLEHHIVPVYNYIKCILGAGKTNDLLRKGSWIFYLDLEGILKPNVDYLREVGVPERFITSAIVNFSRIFNSNHVEFKRIVEEVKQMGFDPLKSTFILALAARQGKQFVVLWDQSIEVYSKWGWTEQDIRMAYKTHPGCMIMSEKKISTTMDFFVTKLGRESREISRCPQVLFYSLEKRIVPRCSVVQLLSLEGLIAKDWKLMYVLSPTEEKFICRYVTRYIGKLPQLHDIYQSKKSSRLTA